MEKLGKNKLIVIQCVSAGFEGGNYAKISINDVHIHVEVNESHHHRGIHIVTFNPANGRIDKAKVFDTYKSGKSFDDFIDREVPIGHVVAAACQDDCVANMSEKAKRWFAKMGSKEILNLKYR